MSTLPHDERRHRKDYTEQEVTAALFAFAYCSGHRDRAAAVLAEQGLHIPAKTIWGWARRSKVEQYERIRHESEEKFAAQRAEQQQALADAAADLEGRVIERLRARLDSGEVEDRDLSAIFRNAAIAGGVHTDKAQLLKSRPTAIVQRGLPEVLRALRAKGVDVIDADAQEEDVPALGPGAASSRGPR